MSHNIQMVNLWQQIAPKKKKTNKQKRVVIYFST